MTESKIIPHLSHKDYFINQIGSATAKEIEDKFLKVKEIYPTSDSYYEAVGEYPDLSYLGYFYQECGITSDSYGWVHSDFVDRLYHNDWNYYAQDPEAKPPTFAEFAF